MYDQDQRPADVVAAAMPSPDNVAPSPAADPPHVIRARRPTPMLRVADPRFVLVRCTPRLRPGAPASFASRSHAGPV